MVSIFYRPNSEHERDVKGFKKMLKEEDKDVEVELVDVNSRSGSSKAQVYDLWGYPAVVAAGPGGKVLQTWERNLPTVSDVLYYANL